MSTLENGATVKMRKFFCIFANKSSPSDMILFDLGGIMGQLYIGGGGYVMMIFLEGFEFCCDSNIFKHLYIVLAIYVEVFYSFVGH